MRLLKKVKELQNVINYHKSLSKKICFVPTMGALHNGHLQLLQEAKKTGGFVVCSIFVNPTQFNDKKDLEKYPRTIEKDIQLLLTKDCDVLFFPSVEEIYPVNTPKKFYEIGAMETLLEGAARPGHFQGVCQVLDRLFSIVMPNEVFFGQKDYQQCMVVKKLLDTTPAFSTIKMNIAPTVREASGLAMSSRNERLTTNERKTAVKIYEVLQYIKQHIKPGNNEALVKTAWKMLIDSGFTPDYIAIADATTLMPATEWDGKRNIVALIAAFLGNVRLIDNIALK